MQFLYEQGWTDGYEVAMMKAVKKNNLASVKWLLRHFWPEGRVYKTPAWVVSRLISDGHLKMLLYLHDLDPMILKRARETIHRPIREYDTDWYREDNATYWAARSGNLETLKWVQANVKQEVSAESLNTAAQHGHLEVLKWLHIYYPKAITKTTLIWAAKNNHLEVVQWLHSNWAEECDKEVMRQAANHGSFATVKWLYANCPESRTPLAIDEAIENCHIDIVCWLQSRFPDFKIGSSNRRKYPPICSFSPNFFETLLYLHAQHKYVFTSKFRKGLRWRCSNRTFKQISNWLDENYPVNV